MVESKEEYVAMVTPAGGGHRSFTLWLQEALSDHGVSLKRILVSDVGPKCKMAIEKAQITYGLAAKNVPLNIGYGVVRNTPVPKFMTSGARKEMDDYQESKLDGAVVICDHGYFCFSEGAYLLQLDAGADRSYVSPKNIVLVPTKEAQTQLVNWGQPEEMTEFVGFFAPKAWGISESGVKNRIDQLEDNTCLNVTLAASGALPPRHLEDFRQFLLACEPEITKGRIKVTVGVWTSDDWKRRVLDWARQKGWESEVNAPDFNGKWKINILHGNLGSEDDYIKMEDKLLGQTGVLVTMANQRTSFVAGGVVYILKPFSPNAKQNGQFLLGNGYAPGPMAGRVIAERLSLDLSMAKNTVVGLRKRYNEFSQQTNGIDVAARLLITK